jgi:multidrug efflux pump subunit AcrA (membrane-fusion protein)
MKNIILASFFAFSLLVSFTATAQLSKEEEKDWKKRLKALEPYQYKSLFEERETLQGDLTNAKKALSESDAQLDEKDNKISRIEGQLQAARSELTAANEKLREAAAKTGGSSGESGIYNEPGVVFRVQIGAFLNKEDLVKFAAGNKNFNAETDNSVQKFTLGVFKDYWQADTFKKYLRSMGVKDAWIVCFKDGQRVPLKDVLSGII